MKTFGTNSLSTFFYYASRIGFIGAAGFLGFVLLSFIIGYLNKWLSLGMSWITLETQDEFSLCIKPISLCINGGLETPGIIPILVFSTAIFYAAVLWFLSKMFRNFMSESIFKLNVVNDLKGLAYTFLIAAVLSFCMMYFAPHDDTGVFAGTLLLLISLILFFIKEVFRQGVFVQEENDLTI